MDAGKMSAWFSHHAPNKVREPSYCIKQGRESHRVKRIRAPHEPIEGLLLQVPHIAGFATLHSGERGVGTCGATSSSSPSKFVPSCSSDSMASVPAFFPPSTPLSSRPIRCAIADGNNFMTTYSLRFRPKQRLSETALKASVVAAPPVEETKVCTLPTWSEFELGRSPVYWKTMNGLPPTSGEDLTLFFNPAATTLTPNDEYGIAFNGGFNQPIMCGGEPRVMTRKDRGEADLPFYTIKIRPPKHAVNLIFSFTNGTDWDGPYILQFQVLKRWRNKPMSFFNEGLTEELSRDGACAEAIFPDSYVVIESCEIGNLYQEGGDRCKLDLVPGCMDPSSPFYDPLANVDDGSCPLESDSDDEE